MTATKSSKIRVLSLFAMLIVLAEASSSAFGRGSRRRSETDDPLPPFQTLTTDEDRERKAETRDPGSYYVLTNPDSFASLPEYRNEDHEEIKSEQSAEEFQNAAAEDPDPDIVIIRAFEEPSAHTRRGSAPSLTRKEAFSTSPTSFMEVSTFPHGNHCSYANDVQCTAELIRDISVFEKLIKISFDEVRSHLRYNIPQNISGLICYQYLQSRNARARKQNYFAITGR